MPIYSANILKDILNSTRETIKNHIVDLVKEVYYQKHNDYPNWDEDEVYTLDMRDLPEYASILVEITDTYDEYNTYERYPINEYIVTLDDDLFFYPAELGDEFHYKEISTDDLVCLYEHLYEVKDKLAR